MATMTTRSLALVIGVLVVLYANAAAAQSNKAAAVAAYEEGKRLMADGKVAEACPKFKASYDADPQLGTMLNLADCHEKLGLLASAWAEYDEVAETAKKRNDNREEYARSHADLLLPRLSHLTIHRPAKSIDKLVVRNDGVDVTALLDGPLPVDPGTHEITAEAPGHEPWKTTVTIEGEMDAEEVTVPPLPKAKKPPPGQGTGKQVVVDSSRRTTRRIIAAASGGVGLIASIAGLYFGNQAFDDWDASRAPGLCDPENVCNMEGQDLIDSANSAALKSNIFIGLGVVGLAAGAILWFTAPDVERRVVGGNAVSFAPAATGDGVGGVISGRF